MEYADDIAFQTLIGTVKRIDLEAIAPPEAGVSNPHRYGQKPGWGPQP